MRGHATDTGIGAEIGRTRGTGEDPTRKIYGRRRSRLRNHSIPAQYSCVHVDSRRSLSIETRERRRGRIFYEVADVVETTRRVGSYKQPARVEDVTVYGRYRIFLANKAYYQRGEFIFFQHRILILQAR